MIRTAITLTIALPAVAGFSVPSGAVVRSTPAFASVASPSAVVMKIEEKKNPFSFSFGGSNANAKPAKAAKGGEDDEKGMMQKVKDAGIAGVISYVFWEWAFWGISIPVCVFGYYEVTGHWPDLSNQDDLAKLGAEAFAFVNVARFAVPLRIGLALGTTPWVQSNIVDRFLQKKDKK